ncbi:class I SAM-dependent methyltransferase [Candidatus Acetothermia bacterium]|nr:class I SAM-dependent methyltransferase [Candidatus Acetothermia bacterium]MBI3643688.1 class I SAM-dependent methyltransferase [Candidatus Acetothermia bacterium]
MDRKSHWEEIYHEKSHQEVSWYQEQPKLSLELIESLQLNKSARILDVGGGASRLAKGLLDAGYNTIAVLDISAQALEQAKNELGDQATRVEWIEANVLDFESSTCFDLWHDRALFHFLTDASERKRYVEVLKRSLSPGGFVIIASFAIGGPEQCSGLPIVQYDAQKLSRELGAEFKLLRAKIELHRTPWNTEQKFMYSLFQRNRKS